MVHATHQQLADELGSVREIVTRLLKGFAEQGFVALGREQLEILDPPGLRRIASRSGLTICNRGYRRPRIPAFRIAPVNR